MILQRLVELAEREHLVEDPAFEPGIVSFLIEIDTQGKWIGLQSLLTPKPRGKGLVGRSMKIPSRGKKTSGILPRFLCDETDYALGHSLLGLKKTNRLKDLHEAWRQLIVRASEETGEIALKALLVFLDQNIQEAIQHLEATCLPLQQNGSLPPAVQISFTLQGMQGKPLFELTSVASWWRRACGEKVRLLPGVRCLISDQPAVDLTQHPAIKRVPGGKPDCALVSFNDSAYESFGLRGFANAPMSQETVNAYTRALNRLLDPRYPHPCNDGEFLPSRRINLSQDTAILYWSSEEAQEIDLFAQVAEPEPQRVEALLRGPLAGKEIGLSKEDAVRFYALTISGAGARVVVRDWFETSVAQFALNVRDYFGDITVVGAERASLSLARLLDATVPIIQDKPDRKRLLPSVVTRLWQDILRGRPFAPVLLQMVVLRIRAEGGVRPAQAALLRGYFNRHRRRALQSEQSLHFPEVKIHMDENNKEPAYLIGRAFAVLEKLQKDAIPGINQTIADRFYGAASATPAVVLPTLIRKSKAHIAKASSGRYLDGILAQILASLDRFPPMLGLEEQGLFAIGYYHQRQALYTKKTDPKSALNPENPS